MLERHFLLPATLAAAIHGALFFGTPNKPAPPPPAKPPVETPWTILLTKMPEEPEVLESFGEPGPKASPENIRPAGEELIRVPTITDFTMRYVQTPPVEIPPDITRVVPFESGASGAERRGPRVPDIVLQSQLDAPPRARSQPAPVYPFAAKHDGLSGQVVVEFVVDESGRVLAPRVVESTNPLFEEPSLRAVVKWRFVPGTNHGRVVRFRMVVPVLFRLGD